MFTRAITRRPGGDFARGLSSADLGTADPVLALRQHDAYVEALREAGLEVSELPPLEGHPDACFVEDAALVLPELAIQTRPGAPSRRGEAPVLAPILSELRPTGAIRAPGTLDGGDVLVVGKQCFIGISSRTDAEGARQLCALLEPRGYRCERVEVGPGLHLKSSVNWIDERILLVSKDLAERPEFGEFEKIFLDPAESYAANCLRLNDRLLVPSGFPRTQRRLEDLRLPIVVLDVSEFRKMDGGLTCLSIRF